MYKNNFVDKDIVQEKNNYCLFLKEMQLSLQYTLFLYFWFLLLLMYSHSLLTNHPKAGNPILGAKITKLVQIY